MPRSHPVKVALAQRGETQKQLAEAVGYSPTTLRAAINGHTSPWPELRRRVAEHLGQPEADLFPPGPGPEVVEAARRLIQRTAPSSTVTDPEVMRDVARLLAAIAPSCVEAVR